MNVRSAGLGTDREANRFGRAEIDARMQDRSPPEYMQDVDVNRTTRLGAIKALAAAGFAHYRELLGQV
ncbi:MAG: hypothetical protein OXF98_11815 [Rhodospirillaceae bacterium]|nr:hypothetical protein [Rhodospirillaceae bacterium]